MRVTIICVERKVSKSQNSEVDRETWSSHVMGHGI